MSDVLVISGNELDLGFRLAGVEAVRGKDAQKAADVLQEEIRQRRHRVIIIDSVLFDAMPAMVRQAARRSLRPVVLSIPMKPSADLEGTGTEFVQDLVREAVGFTVKI